LIACLIACVIDHGEMTPIACTAENLPSPERPRPMTVTATRPKVILFGAWHKLQALLDRPVDVVTQRGLKARMRARVRQEAVAV